MNIEDLELRPDNQGRRRILRAWKPGDGLSCAYSAREARSRPCGRPVAVRVCEVTAVGRRTTWKRTVVCAFHIRTEVNPSQFTVVAEKWAAEKVIAAHWDEYQGAISEYITPMIEGMLEDLPEEIKELIRKSIKDYPDVHDQP